MQEIYNSIITVIISKSTAGIASPYPIYQETQFHLHQELLVALQEEFIGSGDHQFRYVYLKIPDYKLRERTNM